MYILFQSRRDILCDWFLAVFDAITFAFCVSRVTVATVPVNDVRLIVVTR